MSNSLVLGSMVIRKQTKIKMHSICVQRSGHGIGGQIKILNYNLKFGIYNCVQEASYLGAK